MSKSPFNPEYQNDDLSNKVIAGLERISETFKKLLWEQAKQLKVSPIQIQLLIFIAYHKQELCNVSYLAKEFNVTKPTVSDAVRVLVAKGLILKNFSSSDNRSYFVELTPLGKSFVKETEHFAKPLQDLFDKKESFELEKLFTTITSLIYQLNNSGILTVQRMCFGCRFYDSTSNRSFCNLLQKELKPTTIRLDCPEFEEKT
ncbi:MULTISPECIES: MarR family winged helix-turn-helix transcriptional regulator [Altibacter]|uniref:MarR family winged helix-turn-helix transcriptional regulator n=1 Tax=Altibacter TaxID=1535231 RepID=UPI0005549B5B|nr:MULTISPECIES: MarR family winged helix-turn-helix transcriptional regulator [Altibacter]MCW9036603.1 MarR family winged helix-turn-helix transcriptional regulator [Altibacter sp.]